MQLTLTDFARTVQACGHQRTHPLKQSLRIMKLTAFLFVAFSLHLSASVSSQTVTLTGKNLPLESVFSAIEAQTGFLVVCNYALLKQAKPVTVHAIKTPLNVLLTSILKDQSLTFEIEERNIVIANKKEAAPMAGLTAGTNSLQDSLITLRGRVINEKGEPLQGVTVMVKGTNKVTSTDANGYFEFKNAHKADVLEFSYVGYEAFQMKAKENANSVINLKPSIAKLEDVNVTVNTGYQRIRPEQSTGAVSVIKTKEFESRISTNFISGLVNRIPGVMINNDIQFEGNNLFQIRGLSTITGNRNPLIVVDGYPTDLTLDMIDPNEIQSVTVLKDAAAATVYGVRASNGVIVIERKQASAGKARFTFRATTAITPKENYSRYKWDKTSASTVAYTRFVNKTYETNPSLWNTYVNYGSEYLFSTFQPVEVTSMQKGAGLITAEEAERQYAAYASHNNAEDYERLFLRNAATQTYNFNFSGGTQNALYYVTANYTNNSLTQKMNENDRLMLSARSAFNFSKRLSLEMITDYQQAHAESVPIPNFKSLYSYERLVDSDGNPLPVSLNSYAIPYFDSISRDMGLKDNLYYPAQEMHEVLDKERSTINRFTANFKYLLARGFDITFGGIYENTNTQSRHTASENSAEMRQVANVYATTGSNGEIVFNIPEGDFLQEKFGRITGYTGRAQLNYNGRIANDHTLNVILGGEVRGLTEQATVSSHFGYNDKTLVQQPVNLLMFSNTYSQQEFAWGNPRLRASDLFKHTYSDNRFLSGYSNLVYSFKSKYSITGSIRVDQSNLFGTDPQYRYKPLWSVGAAWNIDREPFIQNIDWVKALKLRVATGFNGNVARNVLPQTIAKSANNNVYPSIQMLGLYSYANSRLRWEQTRNHNIGIDYSLFQGISGSVDYYEKHSTDLLANSRIDATLGGTSALINQASIRNRGVELNLHADWITRRKFNWNMGLVLSHNTGRVKDVYNPLTPTSIPSSYLTGSNVAYIKDYPVGAVFAYRYAGLDAQGFPQIYDIEGKAKRPFPYSAANEGIKDVYYAGTSIPRVSAGLSNRIDVGNFYFFCMINYYGGFKVRVPAPSIADRRPLEGSDNYWKQAGDENIPGILPAYNYSGRTESVLNYSDKYLASGDYLTLGDLTASYNFRSTAWVKKAGFSNFEIKLQASNLYTLGLNRFGYSAAMGSFAKQYITPTYTIALFTNF